MNYKLSASQQERLAHAQGCGCVRLTANHVPVENLDELARGLLAVVKRGRVGAS